jgi:hypothetical protein
LIVIRETALGGEETDEGINLLFHGDIEAGTQETGN